MKVVSVLLYTLFYPSLRCSVSYLIIYFPNLYFFLRKTPEKVKIFG